MHRCYVPTALLLVAACAGRSASPPASPGFVLPATVVVLDGATGAHVAADELLRRLGRADLVLLGEVHDNRAHHTLRGQLIAALSELRPAIVFEQFAESRAPIAPPAASEDPAHWLDRSGFDRDGWKWPLHQTVVEAALRHGRSLWGSGLSRAALRTVVREGESAAPAHLRSLLERAPLDSAAMAELDRELIAGHCGQLPATMIPGMRAAQAVRDASMAYALTHAGRTGPAWLIAGNGHVRRDIAVPRLLSAIAPGKSVLTVGFVERSESGGEPDADSRAAFDVVVVTPRAARPDPCAGFRDLEPELESWRWE